jgi:hypothetical protein
MHHLKTKILIGIFALIFLLSCDQQHGKPSAAVYFTFDSDTLLISRDMKAFNIFNSVRANGDVKYYMKIPQENDTSKLEIIKIKYNYDTIFPQPTWKNGVPRPGDINFFKGRVENRVPISRDKLDSAMITEIVNEILYLNVSKDGKMLGHRVSKGGTIELYCTGCNDRMYFNQLLKGIDVE